MKSRVILTTLISLLLLIAAVGAGLNAIFTVTLIDTQFAVCSEAGREDAETLKNELEEFVGSSTTFLDVSDVEERIGKYPCFRVVSVEKVFPKTVKVEVAERKEFFAIPNGESYSILDEDGIYLYDGANKNRLGGENILLEGFEGELVVGERVQGDYYELAFEMFTVFKELLPGLRANVVSLKMQNVGGQDTPENMLFVVQMREGVQIMIRNPAEGLSVKARVAFTDAEFGYLSPAFKDKWRMYGAITVGDLTDDGASARISYSDYLPF